MKTLDDALKTPGVIRPDSYDIGAGTVWMQSIGGQVALGGHGFTPAILRRIADHLDPQPVAAPQNFSGSGRMPPGECLDLVARLSRPEIATAWTCGLAAQGLLWLMRVNRHSPILMATGERGGHLWVECDGCYYDPTIGQFGDYPAEGDSPHPLFGKESREHLEAAPVIPEGWRLVPATVLTTMITDAISTSQRVSRNQEKADNFAQELRGYLSGIGSPFRTEAEVRAEARRQAFERAAEAAAEYCWNRVKNREASSVAVFTSHTWQDIRDAIIAVGKAEFPELTLRPTKEIRREALEEAKQKVKQEAHYPICENGKPDLLHCGLHNCPCGVRKELAKDIETAIHTLIEKSS